MAGRHGVADRLHTAAGDLLEADFGTGHRVATIGHILHSEGRERSRRLLRKTFDAIAPARYWMMLDCDSPESGGRPAGIFLV